MNAREVVAWLGDDPVYARWVGELEGLVPAPVPGLSEMVADADLRALQWHGSDEIEYSATRPGQDSDPELWWLWERCRTVLLGRIGRVPPMLDWPNLPSVLGAKGRWFFVHVLLSVLPQTRAWHRAVGVSDPVSWHTLGDLGAKLITYRQTYGVGGLDRQNWLAQHFEGAIFRLGRLQFDRGLVPAPPGGLDTPAGWPEPGDLALGMHIPEDGPLLADRCDDSIALAGEFFPRIFPAEPYRFITCQSWLLDEQLTEYLPPTSNILAFSSRFHLWPGPIDGDEDIMEFVFRRQVGDLAGVPQDTTLQRAVVAHLQGGRHWHARRGWMALPSRSKMVP